jgi:hypothetical protein
MKHGYILKIVSLIFAFGIFVICLSSVAHLLGFRDGAKWGNRPASEVMKDDVVLSVGVSPSAYELFVQSYIMIAFCIVFYAVARLYDSDRTSRLVAVIPLSAILYKYWQLLQWKDLYLELNADFGYYYWIVNTIPYDWLCMIVGTALLAAQGAVIVVSHRASERKAGA